jgi:hypothetical protein
MITDLIKKEIALSQTFQRHHFDVLFDGLRYGSLLALHLDLHVHLSLAQSSHFEISNQDHPTIRKTKECWF